MAYARKTDKSQAAIVEGLRDIPGCVVKCLHRMGEGWPDLAVGYKGGNYFMEVKAKGGKLTEAQREFHNEWTGSIHIVHDLPEARQMLPCQARQRSNRFCSVGCAAAARTWAKKNRPARNRLQQMRRAGGSITQAQWDAILLRHGGLCAQCGSDKEIHMDHIIPVARGGKTEPSNLQPLCRPCNQSKGAKLLRATHGIEILET